MTQDTTTGIAIPEDVMEAAREQCDLCGITPSSDMRVHAEHVAAFAIVAERERCAETAAMFVIQKVSDMDTFTAAQIAAAIRTPTKGADHE